ncbi:MAG: hypothetical protein MJE63_19045, partial [Proteobacteria bacterium]|nr:hypothetical protein [Pseudomonadota bacterium]
MKFKDIKIGKKMFGSFTLVVLIFIVVTGYQIFELGVLGKLQHEGAKRGEDAVALQDVMIHLEEVYTVMADAVINRDIKAAHEHFSAVKASAKKDLSIVDELVDTDREKNIAADYRRHLNAYLDLYEEKVMPILEKEES